MSFAADYPGAIIVEAANYGYPGQPSNRPRAWFLHTPEEPADNYPGTPYYFHNAPVGVGSTTYFVSYLGFVFQCVPEDEGAYGNAVEGKPYPAWANPRVNLNLQTFSVEIEGYAATIRQTMPRGSPQWKALVTLMAHRCKARGLNPDWTGRHSEVSIYRGDPGTLDVALVVADVKAEMQEEDDMDEAAIRRLIAEHASTVPHYGFQQIADNLPAFNAHLANLVAIAIGMKIADNNVSKVRFKQIMDNMPDMNRLQRDIVEHIFAAMVKLQGGMSEAQVKELIKEVKHTI